MGLFWGWLLFNELRGSGVKGWTKVLGGAAAIVVGACVLAYATSHQSSDTSGKATLGILAALGAGVLWGTMYIPYRKAYISGMNPLSFVTVFTFGELGTTFVLGAIFHGGVSNLIGELATARPALFWLFLGGFCWVIGDLFQQYAAKYIGIGRGIPLSNTNQLWGLAWGALVFGELVAVSPSGRMLIFVGSGIMILGAVAISMADPGESELVNWKSAMDRECDRYGLDTEQVGAVVAGDDPHAGKPHPRRWWEVLVMCTAVGVFVWLALGTRAPADHHQPAMALVLAAGTIVPLGVCGTLLWRRTRFS